MRVSKRPYGGAGPLSTHTEVKPQAGTSLESIIGGHSPAYGLWSSPSWIEHGKKTIFYPQITQIFADGECRYSYNGLSNLSREELFLWIAIDQTLSWSSLGKRIS